MPETASHRMQRIAQRTFERIAAQSAIHLDVRDGYHQAFLRRGGDVDLHAELVRCSGLAFADAFDLGGVQCVQFVLVFSAPGAGCGPCG